MPDPSYEQLIHDVEQIVNQLEPDSDVRELPELTVEETSWQAGEMLRNEVKIINLEFLRS